RIISFFQADPMMILPKRFCSFTEVKNAKNKPFDQNQWPNGKPPFSNKSVTINSPLFRIENCTFHGLCTAFMANLLGVVPIRSIMLNRGHFS
ncbi:hypothetical protein, partial [Enterobacter kobei]|uniref:hypothetical protein n=1 Tax=Enterobacter kobei TaxID=208224 RepID=UPI003D70062D